MPNTKRYQKIVKEQKNVEWIETEPLIMREEGSGTRKEAEKQLSFLCQQGYLIKTEEAGNIRYQKAG